MPIYEYKCKCGKVFEALTLPARENEQIKCPECGGIELTKLISKPFLPNSVGAPANLSGPSPTCCGTNPESSGCTPGSCCADEAGKRMEH